MILHSATITGTSAAVKLATAAPVPSGYVAGTSLMAKWVQVTTPNTNASQVRVGGVEVSSSVGYAIPVGWSGQFLPPISDVSDFYDLNVIYVYVATGDVLEVLYGG
jgi:hypothetical protein